MIRNIKRRDFLKGTVELGVGLAFSNVTQAATISDKVRQQYLGRINTGLLTGLYAGSFDKQNGDFKVREFDAKEIDGRYSVIFFGFQNCPHYCPVSLRNIAKGLQNLKQSGDTHVQSIQAVMVSTDPKRDSVEGYEAYFNHKLPSRTNDLSAEDAKDFIGLSALRVAELPFYNSNLSSGARDRLDIRKRAQKIFEANPLASHGADHAVGGHHLPAAYVMDSQGQYVGTIQAYSSSPKRISDAVEKMVNNDVSARRKLSNGVIGSPSAGR